MSNQKPDIFEVMDVLKRLAETSTDLEAVYQAKEMIKSFEAPQDDVKNTPKALVKIDNTMSCDWLYGKDEMWKDYVCENFDENFVLFGNRYYKKVKEASWYLKAIELLIELEAWSPSHIEYKQYGLTESQFEDLVDFFAENDRTDTLIQIIRLMNPDDTFKTSVIRGYSQGEWQEVLYKSTNIPENIIQQLEAFYFGKITEIFVENGEDSFSDVITDDKLWDLQREGKLKEYFCELYELDLENTEFLESDGQYSVTKYKTI